MMSLSPGAQLGPYRIESPLGAGGMGEVYRAKDTRLNRDVAIKVLPSHLSDSPEVKERFDREARAISQLTHPHICTLHDIGHQDGIDYLVMELLEGETLARRLEKGPLPLEQTLKIGSEIASALERAHRSGVVHRDLKPGNIMLTKTGAKLLDFGLAKSASVLEGDTSGLTVTKPLTSAGTLLGTFQYMAPEQLEGREADARTDLFAFGAVLYEMATGKRAFEGKSQASLISSIMSLQPAPISQVQPMTPPALDQLVKMCLAKDADDRIQTAHDVLLHLRWIAEGGSQAGLPAPLIAARRRSHRLWLASTLVLLAVCLGLAVLAFRRGESEPVVIRSFIPPPEGASFITVGDQAGPSVISPDGTTLAFTAAGGDGVIRLWVRPLAVATARALPGTEEASFPFWSADSRSIAFFVPEKMRKVDMTGGPPMTLCNAPAGRGGTWSRDGIILFAPDFRSPICRVPATGGSPEAVTRVDETKHTSHRWPSFCPDGRHFVYLAIAHGAAETQDNALLYFSLDGGEPQLVLNTSSNAEIASNRLLFLRENSLLAAPFDAATGRIVGEPAVIAAGVTNDSSVWRGTYSSSQNGILAFHSGQAGGGQNLVRLDRSGKELGRVGEPGEFASVRIAPDGKRVATSHVGPTTDVWVYEISRGVKTRLSFETGGSNLTPCWSPDGRSIAYGNIFLARRDVAPMLIRRPSEGGEAEELYKSKDEKWPSDWSRDGNYLLFSLGRYIGGKPCDIWVLPLTGKREPFVFLKTPFEEDDARFSPDGRWVAYTSDESGRNEVYVAPFQPPGTSSAPAGKPARAGKWQLSSAGGANPAWRFDGKEVFYIAADRKLMAIEVNGEGESIEIGSATALFTTNSPAGGEPFDVSADGQWFVVNNSTTTGSAPINLVTNWPAELKKP
ncbi:MAG TPA: protein kinase [Phycisphaerae bacterium]|nr:protein kinase [Phycisphaerae bacterium]